MLVVCSYDSTISLVARLLLLLLYSYESTQASRTTTRRLLQQLQSNKITHQAPPVSSLERSKIPIRVLWTADVLLQLYCCGYQVTRSVLLYTLLICGIININSVMNVFVCLLFCIIYNKIVTPRTDRSISTSWYGSFREDIFLICMIYLAHAAGWELYNLQNLPYCKTCSLSWTCSLQEQQYPNPCTTSDNGGLGSKRSRSRSICPAWEIYFWVQLLSIKY